MLDLGLESGSIKIEEYNYKWEEYYLEEEKLLNSKLKGYKTHIQHVGSTSIYGCSAKPILDIAIGVESLEYGEKLIPILISLGYIYCKDAGVPGRHFFKKNYNKLTTHHIHVEPTGGMQWRNHILFK